MNNNVKSSYNSHVYFVYCFDLKRCKFSRIALSHRMQEYLVHFNWIKMSTVPMQTEVTR